MNVYHEWGMIAIVALSGVRMLIILLTQLERTRRDRTQFTTR